MGRARRGKRQLRRGGGREDRRTGCMLVESHGRSRAHTHKVLVLGDRLLPTLLAILGKVVAVEDASGATAHHVEQRSIEAKVVTTTREEVIASKTGIGLKLVVASKTRLRSRQQWESASASRGIASDGKLLGEKITVGLETEEGQEEREIVADVVDVLLGVYQLVESDDTITGEETVVGSDVETGARSADIPCSRGNESMDGVTGCWDLVPSTLVTLAAVLCIVVGCRSMSALSRVGYVFWQAYGIRP